MLVSIARVLSLNGRLLGKGIATLATPSWKDLMQFKKSFTEPVPAAPQIALEKAGVTTAYHGRAKFIAENTIDVNENILYAQ